MSVSPHRVALAAVALAFATSCGASSTSAVVAGEGSASASPTPGSTVVPTPTSEAGIKAPAAVKLPRTDEFGLVTAVRQRAGELEVDVDRVDMLSGAEAEAAAKAAGADYSNDYFLRNDSPQLRTYAVRRDAAVWGSIAMLPNEEPWPKPTSLSVWTKFVSSPRGRTTLFHFAVDGDSVVGIEEQYRP